MVSRSVGVASIVPELLPEDVFNRIADEVLPVDMPEDMTKSPPAPSVEPAPAPPALIVSDPPAPLVPLRSTWIVRAADPKLRSAAGVAVPIPIARRLLMFLLDQSELLVPIKLVARTTPTTSSGY